MAEEKKVLTDKERYELNERIAQSYYSAYDKKAVKVRKYKKLQRRVRCIFYAII